jgi:predicted flap endonuclease-1-like 5' DNA nuclease
MDLAQLVTALKISVPVLLHTEEDGAHTLYLYGGRVIVATPAIVRALGAADGVSAAGAADGASAAGAADGASAAGAADGASAAGADVDFSVVKGLGASANANLHAAGTHTWSQVHAADDDTLLHSLSPHQLAKLRDWCEVQIRLTDPKEV